MASLSTETLDSYFSEFGDIVERTIMKDQTGRSRWEDEWVSE